MSGWRALGVTALVALGTTASASTPPTASTPPATTTAELLLRMVPAEALTEEGILLYSDLDAVLTRADPSATTDEQRRELFSTEVFRADYFGPRMFRGGFDSLDEAREEVGFSMAEIGQELLVGVLPTTVTVVTVRGVTPSAIEAALRSDPTWSDVLTTATVADSTFFDWGDELDLRRRTPMRTIGRGGQLLVDAFGDGGSVVVRTDLRSAMEVVVRAAPDRSLWSSSPFAPVLAAMPNGILLQAHGNYSQGAQGDPVRVPMLAVQVAPDLDKGSAVTNQLLTSFATTAQAADAAEMFTAWLADGVSAVNNQPISELLPDATVTVEGSLLRVSLPGERSFAMLVRMMTRREFPAGR